MLFSDIVSAVIAEFGEDILLSADETVIQPYAGVSPENLSRVCRFLFIDQRLYFDYLASITGLDNGPENGTMEVIYHLNSIPFGHSLVLKVMVNREPEGGDLPSVPSVSDIWRTADWHEREIYDLLGIRFEGHRDLRRILLPADWEGFPLRKDYREQEYYHGIRVRYENREDPGTV